MLILSLFFQLAEANDYEADVMLIALEKHEEHGMEPLEWIKNKWPDYISTVRALAVNKNVHGLLENDVANALKKHRGNVEKALDTAIKIHKKRVIISTLFLTVNYLALLRIFFFVSKLNAFMIHDPQNSIIRTIRTIPEYFSFMKYSIAIII